jgi:hypothetical protein
MSYRVERTVASRRLLQGDEDGWRAAGRLIFGPAGYRTSFRALRDEEGLYLRFDVVDASPWHRMTKRDSPIWDEEVVEIFLDLDRSGTNYAEIELSPANVVCDVRMISGSPDKRMDVAFDVDGLESRAIESERGWVGLVLVPWEGLRPLPSASTVALPPKPGDRWRFNVYRIERPGGPERPEAGAVFASWSPTGEASFHVPASFVDLEFG